jgi:hypothetical protein
MARHRGSRVNGKTSSAVLVSNEGEGSQQKWTSTASRIL